MPVHIQLNAFERSPQESVLTKREQFEEEILFWNGCDDADTDGDFGSYS